MSCAGLLEDFQCRPFRSNSVERESSSALAVELGVWTIVYCIPDANSEAHDLSKFSRWTGL